MRNIQKQRRAVLSELRRRRRNEQKSFDVHEEHIVIGNGAAELIKGLLEELDGKLGVIRPTFEEYPNRWEKECVVYDCTENDFSYSAEQLMKYFTENPVDALVLINPDNPTGHCLREDEIRLLLQWSKDSGINLIVDESFLDFADDEESLLSEQMLNDNQNLYVVKSISKIVWCSGSENWNFSKW